MNDFIRTTLYTGVGTLVLGKAKFKEFVEELIQNNELTKEEGRRVILAFIHTLEDGKNTIESNFLSSIDLLLKKLNLPMRTELEVKFHEILEDLKNRNTSSLFKKQTDNRPTSI